ncbi:hypothetical protein SA2016_4155 (plasmid) [Sinomonas atrocyanea]|uniref:DUF8175 domain-containing protein n=1 Tax=Sinomonas atrocyanea TaxID=37927 RepID=A0A127A6Q2_9MICC|nr:hypothetical protein [Sinomonas atrocyanea]AMM34807.1 hypothetical protein SA2016_4155 [Sinomonas atrocyanea]GEB64616.1 hypothetical protein SAT01_20640 [Sinomonas atrocyanea]GGG79495.1 hypothetical protein GCM10007172_35810 [Sinomonas atrocyanea]
MSQPTEGQGPPRDQSPWTRPRFIASAAVVVVLAALGLVYLALPSPSNGQDPAGVPSATATATSTAQAGQSACGLPAGDQRYPSVGLPTKWELLGRVAVPTDPKGIGPGRTDGSLRTCYQHSPTGALYAAANIIGAGALPGGKALVLKNLTAKSPMRDQALATPSPNDAVDPSLSTQIGGFKIVSYSSDTATVSIGLKTTQDSHTAYGSATYALRWEGGDWKVVLEDSTYSTSLTDLSGFVPWTGI